MDNDERSISMEHDSSSSDSCSDLTPSSISTIRCGECSKEVFATGHLLCLPSAEMSEATVNTLNECCDKLNTSDSAKSYAVHFDWHFQGGRPMILYSGEYSKAVAVCCDKIELIRSYFPNTVNKMLETAGVPLQFVGPGRRSMGQVLNAKPDGP